MDSTQTAGPAQEAPNASRHLLLEKALYDQFLIAGLQHLLRVLATFPSHEDTTLEFKHTTFSGTNYTGLLLGSRDANTNMAIDTWAYVPERSHMTQPDESPVLFVVERLSTADNTIHAMQTGVTVLERDIKLSVPFRFLQSSRLASYALKGDMLAELAYWYLYKVGFVPTCLRWPVFYYRLREALEFISSDYEYRMWQSEGTIAASDPSTTQ